MGYIKVQTVCLVIIAIAAVKYLLPDIRKLCRMIGGEERKKVKKKRFFFAWICHIDNILKKRQEAKK